MRRLSVSSSIAAAAVASALLAGAAQAARVVDVRIGRHPEFTRIVFQLDEHAEYELSRTVLPGADGPVTELTLHLQATAQPTAIANRRGLVESVRLLSVEGGSVARVRLRTDRAKVLEMTLAGPPRIVIDVSPLSEPARVAARSEEPGPTTGEPEPAPPARTAEPPAEAKPVAQPAETPAASVEAKEPPVAPPVEAPQEAPVTPPISQAAPEQPTADRSPWLDGRLIGTVAMIAILLLVWRRLRRRAGSAGREFPPLDALREAPEAPTRELDVLSEPTAAEGNSDPSALQGEAPAEPASADWGPAAPGDPLVRELERRIQHLERRLEEVGDSRERLERGLASHTEELRVQRSAIARAQRVLRSLTRPEEGAPDPPQPDPGRGSIR